MNTREQIVEIINDLEADELDVVYMLAKKMLLGKKKYGQWIASKDSRNYTKEASEELLDACNYLAMQLIIKARKEEALTKVPRADEVAPGVFGCQCGLCG